MREEQVEPRPSMQTQTFSDFSDCSHIRRLNVILRLHNPRIQTLTFSDSPHQGSRPSRILRLNVILRLNHHVPDAAELCAFRS